MPHVVLHDIERHARFNHVRAVGVPQPMGRRRLQSLRPFWISLLQMSGRLREQLLCTTDTANAFAELALTAFIIGA